MQNVHSVDQTRTNRPHIPSDTIHVKEHRPAGQKPPEAPSSLRATRRPPSHLAPTEHPNRVAAVVSVRPWRQCLNRATDRCNTFFRSIDAAVASANRARSKKTMPDNATDGTCPLRIQEGASNSLAAALPEAETTTARG